MLILQNIIESKYHYQPSWLLLIIVFGVMILGYLYSAFNTRFNTFVKAVFLSRFSVQASREERSLSHPFSLLLSLNFILITSLFVLQVITSEVFFHTDVDFSLLSFLLVVLFIAGIYFVKIIFLRIFSFILDKQETISEYLFIIFLLSQFLGIVLLPVVICTAYGPAPLAHACVYLGMLLLFSAFLVRVGKGISMVMLGRQATLFYLILYLCTLEILPLLIGIKLFERLV